jgi:hypothetical protein
MLVKGCSKAFIAFHHFAVGVTEAELATLAVKSNAKVSYTLAFTSTNSFALVTDNVATTWEYTLALYDGTTKINPTSGYSYSFTGKTPKVGKNYILKITYLSSDSAGASSEWIEAGVYVDTLTISFSAL